MSRGLGLEAHNGQFLTHDGINERGLACASIAVSISKFLSESRRFVFAHLFRPFVLQSL